jgi:hypothetical protein
MIVDFGLEEEELTFRSLQKSAIINRQSSIKSGMSDRRLL